ncbi:MAG: YggS family pyridoxal phosphate-dependent enzyme [Clostridiales bacterium]|jgi:pyridoxal phosphate enzyme (YggS family)|nr:YggS family pyridoxal phosphate-dependent enzyme [Clostridiales bacterium]
MNIQRNIKKVMERISEAAYRSGRQPDDIILVAVTKSVNPNNVISAINTGIEHIGENRVQEFLKKEGVIPEGVKRHFIGRLQTNKVKYIIDKVDLIHSLDRLDLAREIDKRAANVDRIMPVLVQVNIAREATKAGVMKEKLYEFIESLTPFTHIKVKGLMTIAPFSENGKDIRRYFAEMKELYQKLANKKYPNVEMEYLSMGMTNDYEVAIEEGANMVRIGRAIFGERY